MTHDVCLCGKPAFIKQPYEGIRKCQQMSASAHTGQQAHVNKLFFKFKCSMPYGADVTEPDPNPNNISKYLSEPGLGSGIRPLAYTLLVLVFSGLFFCI